MTTDLPQDAIETDHRLESSASKASEALAKHRWHWTLDDTNPERVSFKAYARAVGRADSTIREYVHGYTLTLTERSTPLPEAMKRAKMGAETAAATEAVAEARGVEFGTASKTRPTEVRRVREMARERAEEKGTSVEEEAPKVAEWIAKAERAESNRQEKRKQRLSLRFIEMEGKLHKAKRALTDALNLAHSVPWGDEERQLLSSAVGNVKSLLGLIDLALVGSADVDWDAELASLAGEQS